MSAPVTIDAFTDPCCPWAFTAEAWRLRLEWSYGDQIAWRRLVVISERRGESEARGFTPVVEVEEDAEIAARWGTPLYLRPRPRITVSYPPSLAVVAVRGRVAEPEKALFRELTVANRARGEMTDEPETIARALERCGLSAADVLGRMELPEVAVELRREMHAARQPVAAARQLDHKLGGPRAARRYASPTWVFAARGKRFVAPGFQPAETYETILANLAPELTRRPRAQTAKQVLEWSGRPLSTAEVSAVMGTGLTEAREELREGAEFTPAGSDGFWSLDGATGPNGASA